MNYADQDFCPMPDPVTGDYTLDTTGTIREVPYDQPGWITRDTLKVPTVEGTWLIELDGVNYGSATYFDEMVECVKHAYLTEGAESITVRWDKGV